MTDFLLELRCEEIPARMQAGARASLEKLFREQMGAAGVSLGEVTVWSTPRRLALIARDLPLATEAVSEEVKGPKAGAPPQALEGFLRKTGLTADQLVERGGVLFAVTEKPGRATRDVLAEAIPAIIRAFPWPKSMRWGDASVSTESLRWVRPLSGIVALLGDDLVPCELSGIAASCATLGHRFHHAGEITIGNAADYREKLRACHVIVDHAEREGLIREMSRAAALAAGLTLVEDEGLVIENAGLTEWPVPLLGRFDEAFLEVPPEVIKLTARTNQKYFVCEQGGRLANAFVCTANIQARDGGAAIIDGNRKVLAARLSDARFFWEQDRRKTLAQHAKGLARITFHEKLGTVADKVERVAKLARWLVEEGIVKPSPLQGRGRSAAGAEGVGAFDQVPRPPDSPRSPTLSPEGEREKLATFAEQAALLCKADLVTEMVGEFPELQGLMGGYYARAEGLPDEVADAIRDHYKPVGQGDEVPTAPVTVAVSLADKLDTLFGFFREELLPTGSKDPFALRRAGIAYLRLIDANGVKLRVEWAVRYWVGQEMTPAFGFVLADFLLERLAVLLKDQGVRHDFVAASHTDKQGNDIEGRLDLVRSKALALQAFIGTEDGTNLLAGYKRAANILKKEDWHPGKVPIPRTGEEDPLAMVDDPDLAEVVAERMKLQNALSYTPEPAEKALIGALDVAAPKAEAAVGSEDFAGAMAALASLRAPIDAFFEGVTVNDPDSEKRSARLALLARFRDAVHSVADFSKIEG